MEDDFFNKVMIILMVTLTPFVILRFHKEIEHRKILYKNTTTINSHDSGVNTFVLYLEGGHIDTVQFKCNEKDLYITNSLSKKDLLHRDFPQFPLKKNVVNFRQIKNLVPPAE